MARVYKEPLTLCLVLGLASVALGQGQNRQQQQQQQPSALGPFANPDIQKELKLSEDQLSKLRDALNKVMEKHRDDIPKIRQLPPEEQQKKMAAINEEHNKAVAGVLDAKQWKRYKQIQWQSDPIGVGSLQDPDLQKELKLSDEQKKRIDSAFNDANKKMQEMMKSRESSPEKAQAVIKDLQKKVNDVLTEEQQKSFKELKGPPFQPSPPPSTPRPPRER